MPSQLPVFRGAFSGPLKGEEGGPRRGRRPVIFDILLPDRETSLLDQVAGGLRLVLHVNPRTMQLSYAKQIERVQTRAGFVEFHWGDATEEISFEAATGGFMRLYTGLSNIGGSSSGDQGRRETIAYDKYLDLLALFHNNGAIYDVFGNIAAQGYIKITFDGASHIGWFDGQFTVAEAAETPYQFNLSARFLIDREIMRFQSARPVSLGPASTLSTGESEAAGSPSTALLDPFVGDPRAFSGPTAVSFPTTINPFEES